MRSVWMMIAAICAMALLGGCGSSTYLTDRSGASESAAAALQAQLTATPGDPELQRDLGVIYLHQRKYDAARDLLTRASRRIPSDPKVRFYVGLLMEFDGEPEKALRIYQGYADGEGDSPYARLMASRFSWVRRELARAEMRRLLADTSSVLDARSAALAVFPLRDRSEGDTWAYLGRGLAELIIVDLGNVASLSLVERVRLQALLAELSLAGSEPVDPAGAPRLGRILGAGRVMGGVYQVMDDDRLAVTLSVAAAESGALPLTAENSGTLAEAITLNKAALLALLERMAVPLTPAEREAILAIPTDNLQAFLAWSRGLADEDRGYFEQAESHFQTAVRHDPGFGLATRAMERVQVSGASPGPPEAALQSAEELLPAGPADAAGEGGLSAGRHETMGAELGGPALPGEDQRRPAETVVGSRTGAGNLPEPPPPPR